MSGESPQPIIWNIYKPSGNISALKKKKKKRKAVGRKQEHSYRRRGAAAFLRGPHVKRAGRAGTNKASNWGRRVAGVANSLCKGPEAGSH